MSDEHPAVTYIEVRRAGYPQTFRLDDAPDWVREDPNARIFTAPTDTEGGADT